MTKLFKEDRQDFQKQMGPKSLKISPHQTELQSE